MDVDNARPTNELARLSVALAVLLARMLGIPERDVDSREVELRPVVEHLGEVAQDERFFGDDGHTRQSTREDQPPARAGCDATNRLEWIVARSAHEWTDALADACRFRAW